MKQCRRCDSKDITYVTDYEHLEFSSGAYIKDNGWLCSDCECFHIETDDYISFEFAIEDKETSNVTKTNYKIL